MNQILNKYSRRITQPKVQGASQAMLYGTGMTEEDMDKPQVGIASVWYEGNTCNMHLLELAEKVKEGVEQTGMVGMRFNTIGVSDGISMGTEGMSYSLQSRDLIADSIETIMAAQWYDGCVALPGGGNEPFKSFRFVDRLPLTLIRDHARAPRNLAKFSRSMSFQLCQSRRVMPECTSAQNHPPARERVIGPQGRYATPSSCSHPIKVFPSLLLQGCRKNYFAPGSRNHLVGCCRPR